MELIMPKKHLIVGSESLSIEQKVIALLGCIAHEQKTEMESLISDQDLSLLQLEILHNLAQAPKGGMTVGDLKTVLIDDSPNVSRTLNKLVARGLVIKTRSEEDQRTVHVEITDAGHETHQRADIQLLNVKTTLSETELSQLYGLLQKF